MLLALGHDVYGVLALGIRLSRFQVLMRTFTQQKRGRFADRPLHQAHSPRLRNRRVVQRAVINRGTVLALALRHTDHHCTLTGAAFPIIGGEADVVEAAIAGPIPLGTDLSRGAAHTLAVRREGAVAGLIYWLILVDTGDGGSDGVAVWIGHA
jgi:hypothetical protein